MFVLLMIQTRTSGLIDLCQRRGVRRLALFGSAASDHFDPSRSDLDLLVEFRATSPAEHAHACFDLQEDLEKLFRNRLIHAYASVADEVVWGVLETNLPPLRREVTALLHEKDQK